jgi:hypothetical protein
MPNRRETTKLEADFGDHVVSLLSPPVVEQSHPTSTSESTEAEVKISASSTCTSYSMDGVWQLAALKTNSMISRRCSRKLAKRIAAQYWPMLDSDQVVQKDEEPVPVTWPVQSRHMLATNSFEGGWMAVWRDSLSESAWTQRWSSSLSRLLCFGMKLMVPWLTCQRT